MQIGKNKVVSIDYTLTDIQGQVIDSSKGREPLLYLHGSSNIIPGLENALEGKQAGDSLQVQVAPQDGYGEREDGLQQVVSADQLGDVRPEVGMQFQAYIHEHAPPLVMTVIAVDGDQVTLDGNHPLAGETLHFDVDVVNVREATLEEIQHGHVHGPQGHAH
jgi:FKBP-type peptidyl-prolyl cis-trans isomerase SlyD